VSTTAIEQVQQQHSIAMVRNLHKQAEHGATGVHLQEALQETYVAPILRYASSTRLPTTDAQCSCTAVASGSLWVFAEV